MSTDRSYDIGIWILLLVTVTVWAVAFTRWQLG